MATPWALTPLKPAYQSAFQPLGGATSSTQLQNAYQPTTSYSIAPISSPNTYRSSGSTFAPQPAPAPSTTQRSSAIATLGTLGQGGNASSQPAARDPYSQPQQATSGGAYSSPYSAPSQRSGALTQPGAYEQWYAQNASRYNQPTSLSSYWQSVQGRVQGQRYQPTNAAGAYSQMQGAYSQPGQGMTNAYDVAGQLRNQTAGEGVMRDATQYFSGPNNMADYYNQNRDFFQNEGDIENYYDDNGARFQQAGFGENYAQDLLSNPSLTGLYDNRLVGDELDYFRDPLRNLSYSEQLYESGNQGLNQWYDLQNKRQTEDLQNQMAAMGVFSSGETVEGMARIREGLGAEQARDMAGLAGQADAERRQRADLLSGMASAASEEEVARGNLMLGAADRGLTLDRDAISRLTQGGQLANLSSQFALDRVQEGGVQANNADASRFAQGSGLATIGNMMSGTEINRLNSSSAAGMAADSEQSRRLMDLYQAGSGVDNLGLQAQAAELAWLQAGGQMAGQVDQGNLAQLGAAGGAAQLAQNMYETRERYGFQDPFAAANSMADRYGDSRSYSADEQANMRTQAIDLLMQQSGLSAAEAERRANEWMQAGTLVAQIAALRGNR